jgi:hypothetical protein
MKKVEFTFSQTDFQGKNYGGITLERELTEESIQNELNDIFNEGFNGKDFETASISYSFDKSEFELEFIENLLSDNGEINEEDDSYEVTWTKYYYSD